MEQNTEKTDGLGLEPVDIARVYLNVVELSGTGTSRSSMVPER